MQHGARMEQKHKHRKIGRVQEGDVGKIGSLFVGYRCVRTKKKQDNFTADPLAPDHAMLRKRS